LHASNPRGVRLKDRTVTTLRVNTVASNPRGVRLKVPHPRLTSCPRHCFKPTRGSAESMCLGRLPPANTCFKPTRGSAERFLTFYLLYCACEASNPRGVRLKGRRRPRRPMLGCASNPRGVRLKVECEVLGRLGTVSFKPTRGSAESISCLRSRTATRRLQTHEGFG